MEYIWDVDVFFIEEVFRTILIVWLAAVFGKRRISFCRLVLSGMFGGAASTLATVLALSGILSCKEGAVFWWIRRAGVILAFGSFLSWIAFPGGTSLENTDGRMAAVKKQVCRSAKNLGTLLLSAGILEGGMAFLREWLFLGGLKGLLFMGSFAAGGHFLAASLVKHPPVGKKRYRVRLFLNGKEKEFAAMADSGNRLIEPMTGKPVSIIAAADAKEFLEEISGVLLIPYRSVGTKNGTLPGILFDRMEILSEEEKIRIHRPVVAVSKEPLFYGKDFTMILPECLLEKER